MNRAGHLRLVGPDDLAPSLEEPDVLCRRCGVAFVSYRYWKAHDCRAERQSEAFVVAVCVLGLALVAVVAAFANRV